MGGQPKVDVHNRTAGVLAELETARKALGIIAELRFPEGLSDRGNPYELEGDHSTDARYIYPDREEFLANTAREALGSRATRAT